MLRRLRRIEALEAEGAPPRALLAEVRALLDEAEVWLRSEPGECDEAVSALERCRESLRERRVPLPAR